MTMLPPRSGSLTLASLVLVWSLPASAQVPAEAELEARESQAKRACDSGKVEEGARLLEELLRLTDDGTYIFNLGRCYQQNGKGQQALPHFRSYLRRPDVDPTAATRAREYIAALERPSPVPAPPPAPPAPAAVPTVSPPPASPSVELVVPAPPPASPGRSLRIAGLVSGGVGLAGLATGLAYGIRTRNLEQEKREALERQDRSTEWLAAHNEKGERAERLQWLFLGTGAATVLTGGVLYYLGTRQNTEESPALQAVPLTTPGTVGALISGRF